MKPKLPSPTAIKNHILFNHEIYLILLAIPIIKWAQIRLI